MRKPLGRVRQAPKQAPAGTAHPGHNSTLTLALLKSFPKDLLKIGSAAHRIYIRTGEAGFYGERWAQVTFFAYDTLKTGSGISQMNSSPPQTALVLQLKYKATHWDRWTKR